MVADMESGHATTTEPDPADVAERLLAEHDDAWVRALAEELDRHLSGRGLERVQHRWQLSRAELGALFGVTRQAVSKWISGRVPADRVEQVADVEAITDLLVRYLRPERIPAVVRRPAARLGGANLIELVSAGRSAEALRLTRQMFAFTDAHA
jgi:DNA-binding transcriptional regulator YiaG